MASRINRREFLLQSSASAVLATAAARAFAEDGASGLEKPMQTPFGKLSTGEDVTAGLDLNGKTALITGCNAGIGYETMRVLVLRGARVFGLARNLEKASRACDEVNSNGSKGKAIPFACEQTDFSSVVACAAEIQKLGIPIDMLICNAGVYFIPTLELAEGLEQHFVINHLSHFILVSRLIRQVKAAEQGRIIVVGSDAAFRYDLAPAVGIEFDNLSGQRYYDPGKMYGQSKLANGLFARELARRLSGTRTTANVLNPGWVLTQTMRDMLKGRDVDTSAAKTAAQGAATSCYVATSPTLKNISGEYFEDCSLVVAGGHMRDDPMAAKLWSISEDLTREYLI